MPALTIALGKSSEHYIFSLRSCRCSKTGWIGGYLLPLAVPSVAILVNIKEMSNYRRPAAEAAGRSPVISMWRVRWRETGSGDTVLTKLCSLDTTLTLLYWYISSI